MSIDREMKASIALTRLSLGAKPGEIAQVADDPEGYLLAQIRQEGADQPQPGAPDAASRFRELREYQQQKREVKSLGEDRDPVKIAARMLRDDTQVDFLARLRLAANTEAGFRERWTLFWANHFTVSAVKQATAPLVGPFEQEAIRPGVFGRFEDLLVASSSHPAMLLYLDQAQSTGPDSRAAQFQRANGKHPGLNENLAREIMELHTVGLGADYSQGDVTEFARAMTGWSIGGLRDSDAVSGRFVFREVIHEPGERTIMGRRYGQAGGRQALAVMHDLAASPHTGRHLAIKIARHFVADDPPPTLVAKLEQSYSQSRGDLSALARTLILAPETWQPAPVKFKMPYEFLVSSWRVVGMQPDDVGNVGPVMTAMGQKPLSAPSPKGWPEEAQAWCAPDAVVKRMGWSEAFAASAVGERDPVQMARDALGARLTPPVAIAIARAETRAEGLAILLMSPEFQRR